jgi:hypothetical protein
MIFEFECIEKRYAVSVDIELFSILDGSNYNFPTLYQDLDKLPEVHDIEYGHFDNCIYFSVSTFDDKPSLHKKIERCIEKHLKRCAKHNL